MYKPNSPDWQGGVYVTSPTPGHPIGEYYICNWSQYLFSRLIILIIILFIYNYFKNKPIKKKIKKNPFGF